MTSTYLPLLQQDQILLTLPQFLLISLRAPHSGAFANTGAYEADTSYAAQNKPDSAANQLEITYLLPPYASPLIMILSEVFCLIFLYPSLSPQPTLTCWDRCSRLVEDISSLRTQTQSSILCSIRVFITFLPWLNKKEGFHLSSLCTSWHFTSMPGVFQKNEGVSLPSSH